MKNGSGFGHVAMERPQSKLLLMNYVASRGETIRKKRTDDRWEGTAGSIAQCLAGSASSLRSPFTIRPSKELLDSRPLF
jgi:hypothetical protein